MAVDKAPELPVYCINLDSRQDRWAELQTAFAGTGLKLQRFSATKHAEGWKGCGASHVAIAREAMRRGLPWVLVIEDDATPAADFVARWPAVREALWADRGAWDIFLGGPTYVEGPASVRRNGLIEIDQGLALHFYVLRASAYEKAIAWNPDRHGRIDVYYSNQFRIVTTAPHLALQRPSFSDILGKEFNYQWLFDESARKLQVLAHVDRTRGATVGLIILSVAALAWLAARRR